VQVKKIGYGALGLKPDVLWSLTYCELADMYEAHVDDSNDKFDTEMQRTSWFTSMLMNSTGNYKKQVKPEKLYVPLGNRASKKVEEVKSYIDTQRELLKKKFKIK
jgi:hypothetical protein